MNRTNQSRGRDWVLLSEAVTDAPSCPWNRNTGKRKRSENAHSTTHDETNPQTRWIRMGTADKQGEEEEGMKQLTAGTRLLSPAAQEAPRSLNHGRRRLLRRLSSRGGIAKAWARSQALALFLGRRLVERRGGGG
jgi:hypothetical protein